MTMLGRYVNLCISVMETFPLIQTEEVSRMLELSLGLKQTLSVSEFPLYEQDIGFVRDTVCRKSPKLLD